MATSRHDGAVTVTLVMFCQAFHGLTFGGIALFLPLIRQDFGIGFEQAGMLSAASTLTYALCQIPAGYLADKFGPKRLFFVGVLGTTSLSLLFGMAPTFAAAASIQLVSGVFRALLFAPGLALIASWFPPDRRATAMGLFVVGSFSGSVLLSLVGPPMVERWGWRMPFFVFASLGVCAALVYHFAAKDKPRTGARQPVQMLDALRLFRYPIMWVCSAIQFVRFGVVTSFNFWLPSLLVADRGFTLAQAGWVAGMCAVLTGVSNAFGGYASDRLKNPPLVIGGSLVVLAVTSMLVTVVESAPLLVAVVAVNAVFLQFYFGPLFHVPVEVLGQRVAGMSAGFSNLWANVGALVFAWLLGVIKDRDGSFTLGFVIVAVTCVVGVALSILLAGMRRRALSPA